MLRFIYDATSAPFRHSIPISLCRRRRIVSVKSFLYRSTSSKVPGTAQHVYSSSTMRTRSIRTCPLSRGIIEPSETRRRNSATEIWLWTDSSRRRNCRLSSAGKLHVRALTNGVEYFMKIDELTGDERQKLDLLVLATFPIFPFFLFFLSNVQRGKDNIAFDFNNS